VQGGEEKLVVEGVSNSLNFVVADRGLFFSCRRQRNASTTGAGIRPRTSADID
jgi:hypothetical protein